MRRPWIQNLVIGFCVAAAIFIGAVCETTAGDGLSSRALWHIPGTLFELTAFGLVFLLINRIKNRRKNKRE